MSWPISQLLLQSQCLSRMGTGNDSTATAEEATIINVLMICYICQCFNAQSTHAYSKWMKSQAAFSGRLWGTVSHLNQGVESSY